MDLFLSQAHTGSTLLGSYKTTTTNSSCRKRKILGVGEPTKADFSRTISGVASSLYLVNPGAPSDRERMVLAASLPDSFIFNYRDAVISSEAPAWCPFNDAALHEHIFKRLERSGMANRKKFVTVPVRSAGELCGFRYSGGSTPQNLIFPIGASEINWLVALRNATRLGTIAASASDAEERMPDLKPDTPPKLMKHALRRLRIWRTLNWIAEASRTTGMIRYEPFSVGCAMYENEVKKMQLKGKYERSMLYLGDHYSKESVLLGDISRGGLASDFWTVVEAVLAYKKNHSTALENERLTKINTITVEDWTKTLARSRLMNEHGDRSKVTKTLEAAIEDFGRIGETRRKHLIDFVISCLTTEQRESLYRGVGDTSQCQSSFINLADSILASSAKSGVWVMMHSLLKQITFNILHLVSYEAHRRLIFKIFLPALIALFLAQGGIGDSFVYGVLNLEVLKQRVASATIKNMLSRDTVSSMPESPSSSSLTRNYAEYDIATLYGRLSDCASIPLAINVGIPLHKAVMDMNTVDLVVKYTINTGLAKQRTAAANRLARRLQHRRKVQQEKGTEVESEEEEPHCKKTKRFNNAPIPLSKGKYRENIAGLVIETIHNEDRQINVESIQKLLTARYNRNRYQQDDEECGGSGGGSVYMENEMTEVSIKYIMNFFDNVFHFKRGTILNSIHCNRRTQNGTYAPFTENCNCPDTENHNEECNAKLRNRDAICAESKNPACPVNVGDPKQVASRFQELIMDPPSLTAVEDATAIERVLQNEQMLPALLTNPIFNAVLGAEKGDLGRYVVLCNIVKFMNVLIACLIDGDLPLLAETRSSVKSALEKGKIRDTRKRPFSSSTQVDDAQASVFRYIDAGHCPEAGMKEMLVPECISKLKSIAVEKGRGGRSSKKRQNCDHTFCRLLKFLFFSIEPSKAVDAFTDPASKATLFRLDDICRDRKKYKSVQWEEFLLKPVKFGTEDWVKPGEYTPASASISDDASPVDFYRMLKQSILLEEVVPFPPIDDGKVSSVSEPDDLLKEATNASCEGFRPLLFDSTSVLPSTPSPSCTENIIKETCTMISMESSSSSSSSSSSRSPQNSSISSRNSIVRLACDYIHSFCDTWAHLIKLTSASNKKNNYNICNSLLKLTTNISDENGITQVTFVMEVDNKSDVSQTAILMFALDSFMSLVASSSCAAVDSNKEDSTFVIKIPCESSGEALLNNKGFPAGLCGPFRRWSLNFIFANLSGKSGTAGIAATALADIERDDVDAVEALKCVNTLTRAAQQLDDSEMGRTLSRNKRLGLGSRFSVSGTRQSNQRDYLHHQNLYMKAIGKVQTKETTREEDKRKSNRKRSRRRGDCSRNPLSFADKYVENVKALGIKRCGLPPSTEFASLCMTGAEADACYQTCQSMRGASRMRSLLVKYSHLMKENEEKTRWEWSSPEGRKLIAVNNDGSEQTMLFRVICQKSNLFNAVTLMANDIKHWFRSTAKVLDDLDELKEFLPQMGSAAPFLKVNLLKTLAGVYTVRDTVGFRIPDHSKKRLPKTWNTPMSVMGITSCRYDKIIEVIDLLISGGAFVTSCLNHNFFFEHGIKPSDSRWLHTDVLSLATNILRHNTKPGRLSPTMITNEGITVNNVSQVCKLSRQSINATIALIIQDYSDISSDLRKKSIQSHLSENENISHTIFRMGAFRALTHNTVTLLDPQIRDLSTEGKNDPAASHQLKIEAMRKSAVSTALIFTRQALDNAMSLDKNKTTKMKMSFI